MGHAARIRQITDMQHTKYLIKTQRNEASGDI